MDNSILNVFTYFKTILCMCPECSNIMRLSDMHLRSRYKSPRTWLDTYEAKTAEFEEEEIKSVEEENELKRQARDEGRRKAKKLVKKSMSKEFSKLRFDPYDIKAILHPVDFVVFNGMNDDMVRNVILMSKRTTNPYMSSLHRDVEKAIKTKSYDWTVVRVSRDGGVIFE